MTNVANNNLIKSIHPLEVARLVADELGINYSEMSIMGSSAMHMLNPEIEYSDIDLCVRSDVYHGKLSKADQFTHDHHIQTPELGKRNSGVGVGHFYINGPNRNTPSSVDHSAIQILNRENVDPLKNDFSTLRFEIDLNGNINYGGRESEILDGIKNKHINHSNHTPSAVSLARLCKYEQKGFTLPQSPEDHFAECLVKLEAEGIAVHPLAVDNLNSMVTHLVDGSPNTLGYTLQGSIPNDYVRKFQRVNEAYLYKNRDKDSAKASVLAELDAALANVSSPEVDSGFEY